MSKPFTDMKKTIILIFSQLTVFAYGGGMPVIDVAAIASQRQADHLDYLEQLIHEGNQVKTIAQLVEQIRLIDSYLERFGDPHLALAAYNAGPDAVRQHGGIPPYRETQNHVVRVMAVVARLEGSNS